VNRAGGARVVSAKVPEERLAGIVGRSPVAPRLLSRNGTYSAPLLFSGARAGQNEQP
jgi:hypothetical protein